MADFKQHLRTDKFSLIQTKRSHFEPLYQVASDPLIWEQHPAQDRWRREIFSAFFEEGLSNDLGCFTIVDSQPQDVIGSTRFYAHNPQNASVRLGYTFLSRNYWGTGANALIKTALLDHSFQYVESIYFDIGETNWRSIKATESQSFTRLRVKNRLCKIRLFRSVHFWLWLFKPSQSCCNRIVWAGVASSTPVCIRRSWTDWLIANL